jgi:hypothetical protein
MTIEVLLAATLLAQVDSAASRRDTPPPTYEEFMVALHNPDDLANISYLYEGVVTYPGAQPGDEIKRGEYTFTGYYLVNLKDDSQRGVDSHATYVDVYFRNSHSNLVTHKTYASTRRDELLALTHSQLNRLRATKAKRMGNLMRAFNLEHSPDMVFRKRFLLLFDEPDGESEARFRFRRGELLDGHTCVVLDLDASPNREKQGSNYTRYWIDAERSYNVLKIEKYMHGRLAHRVDGVRLKRLDLANAGTSWYPVAATYNTFLGKRDEFTETPQISITFNVLQETVAVNQPLNRRMFAIDHRPSLGGLERISGLERDMRRQEESIQGGGARGRPLEFNELSDRLEKQLQEANRQSREVVADYEGMYVGAGSLYAAPAVLFCSGIITVLGGGFVIWRHRRASSPRKARDLEA